MIRHLKKKKRKSKLGKTHLQCWIRLGRKTCEAFYTLLSETAKHYFLGIIWYGIDEIIGGFSKDVIERRTATGSSLSHSWAVVLPLFSGKSSL